MLAKLKKTTGQTRICRYNGHDMIRWFAKNDIASNLLMLAIVLAGLYTAFNKIPLEVQPSYDIG
ncbi:hypothetical protein N9044_01925, partial [bacterium]|nr:hypothetical protein [bacterium]